MTVKLMVLYTHPDDAEAFEQHYFDTHMPLARAIPGLDRVETGKFAAALDGGENSFYRHAELYFADDAAMSAAFGSPQGQATAADYAQIAPPGSRMFVANIDE
jgi:uncharacterized protein (TIGR02118 family)